MESFFFVLGGGCLIAVLLVSQMAHLLREWAGVVKLYVNSAWWTLPMALPFFYGSSSGPRFSEMPLVQWPAIWNALALFRMYFGVFALLVGLILLARAYSKKEPWLQVALASLAMALPYLVLGLG